MYEPHESCDGFLTSERDPAESFEFVEETLDLMALLVEPPVDWGDYGAARICLDLGGCTEVIGDEGA